MKLSRYRTHKVNLGNYENVEFGASVTIDTDVDGDLGIPFLNRMLDDLLEADMNEAIANVPGGQSTHAETWRR